MVKLSERVPNRLLYQIGRLYLVIKLDGMPSHIHLFCRGAPAGVGLSIASSEEEGRVYRTLEEICNIGVFSF